MIRKEDIRVIIPAFNEGPAVGDVVRRVLACGYKDVVVIDDGSSDDTGTKARQAGARVVSHLVNRGAGAVAQTGILLARKEGVQYLVQLDADGQHYPEDIDRLVEAMDREGGDLVIGSRFLGDGSDIPRKRILYNAISNVFTNWFCASWYSDTQSGFRLLGPRAIRELQLQLDGFGYCSEMIVQAEQKRFTILEVPIRVRYSAYSLSKGQDLHTGVTTAMNLLWKLVFYPKH